MTEPQIQTRAAQPYLGVTATVTMTTFHLVADRIGEIVGLLLSRGQEIAGAPFLRYHVIDMDAELVVEAGVPVAEPQPGEGEIKPGELPAGRYVTLIHHGHPDGLIETITGMFAWAEAQGLTWDMTTSAQGEHWGCRMESYLTNPQVEPDMNKWDTELAYRLAD
ncbi:GyrI-like domain-containing protein [Crossiella sp. CA198]|uniref:GyrI-like domain-containing protein n=1 Tax=Crossiella sp. CA198 TaxID=3455607 RepID=UPI003F8D8DF3